MRQNNVLDPKIKQSFFSDGVLYCCLSIPSSSDLAFDLVAYTFILLNDAFTAAMNVYTKKSTDPEVLFSVQVAQ